LTMNYTTGFASTDITLMHYKIGWCFDAIYNSRVPFAPASTREKMKMCAAQGLFRLWNVIKMASSRQLAVFVFKDESMMKSFLAERVDLLAFVFDVSSRVEELDSAITSILPTSEILSHARQLSESSKTENEFVLHIRIDSTPRHNLWFKLPVDEEYLFGQAKITNIPLPTNGVTMACFHDAMRTANRICGSCSAVVTRMQTCSLCRNVVYCDKKCQADHWKNAHRSECSRSAAVVTHKAVAKKSASVS
jgi:hypothetical protein